MRIFSIALSVSRLVHSTLSINPGLDTGNLSQIYFGNDAAWYETRIPFFECSDTQLQDVFYYRWKVFRAHQRDLGARGYISTEFLEDVSWQLQPWASLNDATGFHISEGRWLRDRRFTDDYIRFMFNGGDDRHFTDYISDSTYGRFLVDGDSASLTQYLNQMIDLYNQWDDQFDTSKGLYYREPIADATEYTISSIDASGGQDGFFGGTAFRPTINSYMWASARAIANVARLAGNQSVAADFTKRATTLKRIFQRDIWNSTFQHFIDRYQVTNQYVTYWEPIRGRELAGLVPWMFSMPDDNQTFSQAWTHLLNTSELRGSNGMRTNEPSYQYYMHQYRYDSATGGRECQWNGPVWPYQTTQVLLGMANLLNSYHQKVIEKKDYVDELQRFTRLHYLNGTLDIQEDYEPDEPSVIVGLPRSNHYFHSAYNDLIISGLVGIRPRADNIIEVNPLIPTGSNITSFRLQNVSYHGHSIAVEWNSAPGHGLSLEVDDSVVASSPSIRRLTATLSPAVAPQPTGKIAKTVQLTLGQYPIGSASSGNDTDNVHAAIDGRIIFFPEAPNGWVSNSTSKSSQQWYSIDFGSQTSISSCELAFYADNGQFALPTEIFIQRLVNGKWSNIWSRTPIQAVANGVVEVSGTAVMTTNLRIVFKQAAKKQTRLVEFKAF